MQDDQGEIDLLLKQALRDLVPDQDPPRRVWESIRRGLRTSSAPERSDAASTDGVWDRLGETAQVGSAEVLRLSRAFFARFPSRQGDYAWDLACAGLVRRSPSRVCLGRSIYGEQQVTAPLWVFSDVLTNYVS